MKIALLYGSSYGKTRAVVKRVVRGLSSAVDVYDVKDEHSWDILLTHNLLLFFCPSYGDEELQSDMEVFFRKFNMNLTERWFVVCELGNYYGYENFSFGPLFIIRDTLLERGGIEFCEPLSLDSFPRTHWGHLDKWLGVLNGKIHDHL